MATVGLLLLAYTLPLKSFFWDVGIAVDAAKAVLIWLLAARVVWSLRTSVPIPEKTLYHMFLVLGLVTTVLMIPFTPNPEDANQALFRNHESRWIVQAFMAGLDYVLYITACEVAAKSSGVWRICRECCRSIYLLAFIGLVQVALFFVGIGDLGIFTLDEQFRRDPAFSVGGVMVRRLSSLGGEPKHLAASMMPILLFVLVVASSGHTRLRRYFHIGPLTVLSTLFVFIGTFSTGTFFAVAVCSPAAVIWIWKSSSETFKTSVVGILVLIIVLVSALGVPQFALDILQARTVDRAGNIDFPEAATLDFLQKEPSYLAFGVGFGNVGFHAHEYLQLNQDTARYLVNNTLPLASKAIALLAETGILGVLLFGGFQLTAIVRSARVAKLESNPESRTVLYGLIMACIGCVALELFSWSPFTPLVFGLMSGYSYRCFHETRKRPRHLASPMYRAGNIAVGAGS